MTEAISGVVVSVLGVISMISALFAFVAKKDSALTAAKVEIVRSEVRADMAAMELRMTGAINLAGGSNPERLARIEEQMKSLKAQLENHASSVQLQLTTLAKIRQGCEECLYAEMQQGHFRKKHADQEEIG